MSLDLPPPFGPVPRLRASVSAVEVTRAVRYAAALAADVHAALAWRSASGGGSGASTDAATSAGRALAREADRVAGSLEVATRALERFEQEVDDLTGRRGRLDDDGVRLDATLAELRARAAEGGEDPALHQAAAWARSRHATLGDELGSLLADEAATEDRLLRALQQGHDERTPVLPLSRELEGLLGRPDAVRDWWARLDEAERAALVLGHPDLVVNAGGLPALERDDAGRVALERDLATASGRRRELLEALLAALGGGALLLSYDSRGDGRATIAHGDPDTADRTVVLVPGLGTDLSSVGELGERAQDVRDAVLAQGPGGSIAVVTWIGYDAPDLHLDGPADLLDAAGVLHEGPAESGARDLVAFVDGLRGSDAGEPSDLTVVGHSYGSTTTGHAAADGLAADTVVLLASPGAGEGNDHASDLGDAEVFVGSRDHDPVTWLGGDGPLGLGPDPAQESFGGTRFDVGDGRPFHADQLGPVGLLGNHTSYFEPGSDALTNLAAIIEGDRPEVVPGRDDPARDLLLDWIGGEVVHAAESVWPF